MSPDDLGQPPMPPPWVRVALLALGAVWASYLLVEVTGVAGAAVRAAFTTWVYTGLMWSATALVAVRAWRVRADRAGWALLAAGAACWSFGDLLWTVHFDAAGTVPTPSVADLSYYLEYPLAYVGVGLLVRARLRRASRALWLDGLVVCLGLAAACFAVVVDRIAAATDGRFWSVATTVGYPVADVALLCLATIALALCSWRPDRGLACLVAWLVISAVADGWYSVASATPGLGTGTLLETLWPASALALAAAAWQPRPRPRAADEGLGVFVATGASALLALGVLVVVKVQDVSWAAVGLAVAALLTAIARCGLGLHENVRLVRASRHEAGTDALTGLGNRRRLLEDLEAALARATPEAPQTLVFCDLDGFKQYNDAFGHGAGDALLARLGARLDDAARGTGRAYRLGGDEFCVLLAGDARPGGAALAAIGAALSEGGDGFAISASHGVVSLPADAGTATVALQLADERMYADKESQRPSLKHHARTLLMRVLDEREPAISEHVRDVAALALDVGHRLRLEPEALDELARAAELHDIGKVAMPDAILHKAGPLEPGELAIIRQHTVVAERILAAAPPLRPVGRIVRASHERWDGTGYPDRLAGEAIPLGARIIAVCDAFDAMTTDRPHSPAVHEGVATAELRRCAGTQFDPAVVDAFLAVRGAGRPEPALRAPARG